MLLCVVVVMGGWFFLLEPSMKEKNEVATTLVEKKAEVIKVKSMYHSYRGAKEQLAKENKSLEEITTGFSKVMDNEDIDQMLTGLTLLHGLRPISLNIGDRADANVEAYKTEESEESNTEESDASILKSVDVTISVEGSLTSVYSLADELKDDYSIKLRNFSYASGEETSTHVLDFTIYMLAI